MTLLPVGSFIGSLGGVARPGKSNNCMYSFLLSACCVFVLLSACCAWELVVEFSVNVAGILSS